MIEGSGEFLRKAKLLVTKYTFDVLKAKSGFTVYVVWCCKTLQNQKALLSTDLPDGMYYEVTYNGDKNELYLDAYKKMKNFCYTSDLKPKKERNSHDSVSDAPDPLDILIRRYSVGDDYSSR